MLLTIDRADPGSVEIDLSGSAPMKWTTVMSAGLRVLWEKPGSGEGNPIVLGAARLGSADSLRDIRDSGGEAWFGGLDIPGERPGSED